MEEKKTRFVVYSDDYYGRGGRSILGHVNTLAEAQELLVNKWKKSYKGLGGCEKEIKEILSHTEDELVGRDDLTLNGCNCYFSEGIARVPGYVDEDEKVSKAVTLGVILKRELAEVDGREWNMTICDEKDKFVLQIHGQNKVAVGIKYEHIVGLPTHHVDDYYVYSGMRKEFLSDKTFPDVDWSTVSAEEADDRLREYFLSRDMHYSEEDAVSSLPDELVLDKHSGGRAQSIAPYDKYGYHIEHISAYCEPCGNGQGVFIHIKR